MDIFRKTAITFLTVVTVLGMTPGISFAFIGPSAGQTPGTGGGLFNVDSNRNIGFGTESPSPSNILEDPNTSNQHGYIFTVASTTNPGIGLYNTTSGIRYLWSARNNGPLDLFRDNGTDGKVYLRFLQGGRLVVNPQGFGWPTSGSDFLMVGGGITASSTIVGSSFSGVGTNLTSLNTANLTAGAFASGNYAFPSSLAVGTSTTVGLPSSFYVSGGDISLDSSRAIQFISSNQDYNKIERDTTNGGLAFYTGGNQNLTVLDTGDVGIGTASPNNKLEVDISSGGAGNIAFFKGGAGGGGNNTITIGNSESNGNSLVIGHHVEAGSGDYAYLGLYGNEQLITITDDSSGQVGIGTSTPATALHVIGQGIFTGPVSVGTPTNNSHAATKNYVDSTVGGGGTGGDFTTLSVSATSTLAETSGNVGIGTTNPTELLHLDSHGGVGSTPGIFIQDPSTASNYGARIYYNDSDSSLNLDTRSNGSNVSGISIARDTGVSTFGSQILGTAGSSGSPAYSFSADSNLGLFRQGENILGVQGQIYMSANSIDMNSHKIVNLATPTSGTDAANKSYVDSTVSGGTSSNADECTGDATCEVNSISISSGGIGNSDFLGGNVSNGSSWDYVLGTVAGDGMIFIRDGGNTSSSTQRVAYIGRDSSDNAGRIALYDGSGNVDSYFDGNGDSYFGGNVGIGDTTPSVALDVNGSIYGSTYYDKDNTSYYVNPSGASNFNGNLTLNGGSIIADNGGGSVQLKPDTADHTYLEFYADSQAPNTRSGWIGYGSAASTILSINNELGTEIDISDQVDVSSNKIINLATPTASTDAANKSYVDSTVSGGTYWTSTSNHIYNSNSGNVGIGTGGVPTSTLHVQDTTGTGTNIVTIQGESDSMIFENHNTGDYRLLNTQQNNGIEFYDGTGGLAFLYNGSSVMDIDSSGGVDILSGGIDLGSNKITSLATPTANTDAANKSYVDSTVSGGTSSNADACSGDATCETNAISASGDVTIQKNTDPNLTLTAVDAGSAPAATANILLEGYEGRAKGIFFTDEDTTNEWFVGETYSSVGISIGYDTTAGGQSEYPANSALFVDTSRQVGIGDTTPSAALDVSGNIYGNAYYDKNNTSYYINPSGSSNLNGDIDVNGNSFIVNTGDGFEIGQDNSYCPGNDCYYIAKTDSNSGTPDGDFTIGNRGSDNIFEPAITVDGGGNVGIGLATSSSPGSQLEVNGQVDVNSNKIISLATPTAGTDAANKSYVDSTVSGGTSNNADACSGDATCETNAIAASGEVNIDSGKWIFPTGTSNATFSDWVQVTNTGLYSTGGADVRMDLDSSTSNFQVRSTGDNVEFQVLGSSEHTDFLSSTLDVNSNTFTNVGQLNLDAGGEIHSDHNGAYIIKDHANGNVTHSAAGGDLYLGYQNTANLRFNAQSATNLDMGNNDVVDTRYVYASTFYDDDNTTYYMNPAGNSNLNGRIDLNGGGMDGLDAEQALVFDAGQAMITVHDGFGNFNILSGIDHNNTLTAGDGGTRLELGDNGLFDIEIYSGTSGTTGSEAASFQFGGTEFDISSANLDLNSNNINNVNKLTANTIDPVYTIGNTQYATYMAGMTGLKEETTNSIVLSESDGDVYKHTIDFDEVSEGSDLWLFWQTTDFGDDWKNLVVLLTQNFNGNVWYKKDLDENTLTVYGEKSGEVSYRMTAPRFDHKQWSNYSDGETQGLIVPAMK